MNMSYDGYELGGQREALLQVDSAGVQRFILKYDDASVDRLKIDKFLIARRANGNEKENGAASTTLSFW